MLVLEQNGSIITHCTFYWWRHTITEIKLYCTIKGLLGDQLYKDFCKSNYILVIDSAWFEHLHPQQSKDNM